jgi:hypothetical protein
MQLGWPGPRGDVPCCNRLLMPPVRVPMRECRSMSFINYTVRVVKISNGQTLCDPVKYTVQ